MSKGRWRTTRDHIICSYNIAANFPDITKRAELVKKVMSTQRISYSCANHAVGIAMARNPGLFKRFTNETHYDKTS